MEEKKDSCCSSSCGGIKKILVMLLIGAFIFASGMWYAKSHCMGSGKAFCPISGTPMSK